MDLEDVLKVLRVAAEYDDRVVTAQMAMAWHPIVKQYDAQDAIAAVIKHYAESTERIMPAHVRKLIPAARDERKRLEGRRAEPLALPGRFESDAERDARIQQGKAKVQQVINRILSKRAVDGGPVWERSKAKEAKGAWWEDPKVREEHARQLLAESGRLHMHRQDEGRPACRCEEVADDTEVQQP